MTDPTTCSRYGERPAVVHLTKVVDGATTTLHPCEECAPWFERSTDDGGGDAGLEVVP